MKNLTPFLLFALCTLAACKKEKKPNPVPPTLTCHLAGYTATSPDGNKLEYVFNWQDENRLSSYDRTDQKRVYFRHGNNYTVVDGGEWITYIGPYYDYDSIIWKNNKQIDVIYTRPKDIPKVKWSITHYFYNGDKLDKVSSEMYDDQSDRPDIDTTYYTWDGDNVVKVTDRYEETTYTYDLTRPANIADATNIVRLQSNGIVQFRSKNLVTSRYEQKAQSGNYYSYEFDDAGILTKMYVRYTLKGSSDTLAGFTSQMKYICK